MMWKLGQGRRRGACMWAIVAGLLGSAPHALAMDEPQVWVVEHGRKTVLAREAVAAAGLVGRCEEQLRTADGVLRLAVSPQLLDGLRQGDTVLEIEYPKTRTFTLAMGNRTVEIKRLLIPLSGELAGPVTTIFHGDERFRPGPYRNSRGTGEIQALVDALIRPAPR